MPFHLYNTAKWKQTRSYQLTIEPLCRMCAQIGKHTPATVADHIEPHRGDTDAFWANELQSLCTRCHSAHKQAQEKGGYLRGCAVDGSPIDPAHPWNAL